MIAVRRLADLPIEDMPHPDENSCCVGGQSVTVFRRTAGTLASPMERRFSEVLAEHLRMAAGINASPAERRSWDRSLPVLAQDLVQAGLSQVEMLIEYQLLPDVVIGDWGRPWNAKGDWSVGSAPPSALWATLDGGFDQVGCVYTAQGFEYDWNGVIVGPDLLYRDGQVVTVRSASKDPALVRGDVSDAQADQLIRNTYKVLLTRGMIGTVLFSTDAETQRFLASLVG
jgi:hypothetical protein